MNTCPDCPNDLVCHDQGECLRTTPETPDYGEPWALDSSDVFWNKVVDAAGKTVAGVVPTRRAVTCVNACAGMADPAAEISKLKTTLEQWETEIGAAMPPDFKDWHENDKSEWPLVARRVIESLHDRETSGWDAAARNAAEIAELREALDSFDATDKERNDALKVCMNLLETMHFNRRIFKVDAYTDEIEAAMAQIKTCYDPHAD